MQRVAAAILVMLAGCVSLPIPTPRDVDRALSMGRTTTLDALTGGRQTYLSRCGTCHQHYLPAAHAAAEWPRLVDDMRVRAKLEDADVARIVDYLVVLSEAPPP